MYQPKAKVTPENLAFVERVELGCKNCLGKNILYSPMRPNRKSLTLT